MNAIIFANLLKDQNALKHLDPGILQVLLKEYPYSQPIQWLVKEKASIIANEIPLATTKKKAYRSIDEIGLASAEGSPFSNNESPVVITNSEELQVMTVPEIDLEADLEEEVLYFEIPDRKVDGLVSKNEFPTEVTMGKKKDKRLIKKIREEVLKSPVKHIPTPAPEDQSTTPNPKGKFRSWQERTLPINDSDEEEEVEVEIPEDFERLELVSNQPKPKKKKANTKAKAKSKAPKKKKKSKKDRDQEIAEAIETKAEEKTKKKAKVKHFARESIKNKPSLISETLALLLAKQGHIEKSIAMYEKLRLLIPEKSDFFASQIEKLKKL